LIALVVVSLLALLAATVVSARLTRSLEELASAAAAVSLGRLDAGASEVGSVEVRKVSRAFNAMIEHVRVLLRTVAQQRAAAAVGEFAASLAHEIRNPLTAVRLDIEDARDRLADPSTAGLLDHALAEIDRLDSTVRGTLRIAASGTIDLAPMDLSDPVRAAIRAAQPRSQEVGASIERALDARPTRVRGNAAAIEQLVLNLVLNAIDAAGDGGHVRVSVESSDGRAWVAVDDDGPGISETDLARVEDPFFTTKPGGTGLGLSVARRIADAHGGELRLKALASGGTRASFLLALLDRNEMEAPSVPKRG
jgi:two-component system sensor histidine kinase AtoS